MDCLIDYIGILGCSDDVPESGLFINDLPGVSMESIAKLANAEQVTFLGVWEDVQRRAVRKFSNRINAEFKKRFKLKTLTKSIDLLRYVEFDHDQLVGAGNWRGFTIELNGASEQHFVYSAYIYITIQSLTLYLKAVSVNPIEVKIFDLDSGLVLDTFSILDTDQVVGWNTVRVNTAYQHYRLFVAYDATDVTESPFQNIWPDAADCFCSYAWSRYGYGDARIRGAISDTLSATVTDEELTADVNTYGLSGIFSVGCKYDPLVCNNRDVFATALWYLEGHELMIERINSNRINRYTTIDFNLAQKLGDYFLGEFEKELSIAVDGIDLDLSDACVECNQNVQIVESYL